MGPYCKFCNQRCFVPMPTETPERIVKAYGTSTIIATCPEGQKFEKEKIGYCYDYIQKVIKERGPVCRVCGCTDDDCSQCIEKTGNPCYWIEEDLCSACAEVF